MPTMTLVSGDNINEEIFVGWKTILGNDFLNREEYYRLISVINKGRSQLFASEKDEINKIAGNIVEIEEGIVYKRQIYSPYDRRKIIDSSTQLLIKYIEENIELLRRIADNLIANNNTKSWLTKMQHDLLKKAGEIENNIVNKHNEVNEKASAFQAGVNSLAKTQYGESFYKQSQKHYNRLHPIWSKNSPYHQRFVVRFLLVFIPVVVAIVMFFLFFNNSVVLEFEHVSLLAVILSPVYAILFLSYINLNKKIDKEEYLRDFNLHKANSINAAAIIELSDIKDEVKKEEFFAAAAKSVFEYPKMPNEKVNTNFNLNSGNITK